MKVAITSTVVLEVGESPLPVLEREFRAANEWGIGRVMETVTGRLYIMRSIDHFEVVDVTAKRRES